MQRKSGRSVLCYIAVLQALPILPREYCVDALPLLAAALEGTCIHAPKIMSAGFFEMKKFWK